MPCPPSIIASGDLRMVCLRASQENRPHLTSCKVQVVLDVVAFRGVGIRQRGEVLRDAEHFPAADLQIIPFRFTFGHIRIALGHHLQSFNFRLIAQNRKYFVRCIIHIS